MLFDSVSEEIISAAESDYSGILKHGLILEQIIGLEPICAEKYDELDLIQICFKIWRHVYQN